jgi:hypothetical protein
LVRIKRRFEVAVQIRARAIADLCRGSPLGA